MIAHFGSPPFHFCSSIISGGPNRADFVMTPMNWISSGSDFKTSRHNHRCRWSFVIFGTAYGQSQIQTISSTENLFEVTPHEIVGSATIQRPSSRTHRDGRTIFDISRFCTSQTLFSGLFHEDNAPYFFFITDDFPTHVRATIHPSFPLPFWWY